MNKLFGTKSEPPSSEDTVARNEELAAELAMEAEESESYSASYTATSNSSDQIKEQSMNIERTAKRSFIVALCVVLMGAAASAGFLYIGIATANKKQEESFERRASDLANEIESSWRDYETTALWIHESCRNWRTSNFTHRDFRILYEYIVSGGLDFNAAEWVPNVTHAERETIENAGYELFYVQPELPFENYRGFQGFEPNPENPDELVLLSQSSKQDFYFPIQFIEPLYGNDTDGYHLDLYSTPWERPTIDNAINKWEPTLTPRFRMTVDPPDEKGYTVVLYHPGNKLSEDLDIKPRDLSNLVIKVNALLSRAARLQSNALGAYLYDTTIVEARDDEDPPAEFLGGLKIKVEGSHNEGKAIEYVTEVAYDDLRQSSKKLYFEKEIKIGSRYWKIVVLPVDDSYKANVTFVILTGVLIFGSAMLLAIWMVNNTYKSIQMHRVMTKAAAEAAIVTNLFPADVRVSKS